MTRFLSFAPLLLSTISYGAMAVDVPSSSSSTASSAPPLTLPNSPSSSPLQNNDASDASSSTASSAPPLTLPNSPADAPLGISSSPAAAVSSSHPVSAALTKPSSSFSAEQIKELQDLIKSTLSENPETVINALQSYSEKQQIEQQEETQKLISAHKDGLLNKETSSVIGNPDGTAQLVVFVDPNCPHCRELEKILHTVAPKFPELAVHFRYWAILGDDSADVVKGIVAAHLQNKFEAVSLKIAQFENRLNLEGFLKLAQQAGLNIEQLKKDMASEKVSTIIADNKTLAETLKLQATPTTILSSSSGLEIITPTEEDSLIESIKKATSPVIAS